MTARFQPSVYSGLDLHAQALLNGRAERQARREKKKADAETKRQLAQAGVGVAKSGAGKGLLSAAKGAAAIPGIGWWVAGAAAATAGTIAIVKGIRKRKARKADIVRIAQQYNMPDVEEMPGFAIRAIKASDKRREKLAAKYEEQIEKLEAKIGKAKRQRKQDRLQKKLDKLKSRLAILAVAEQLEQAEQQGKEEPIDKTAASLSADLEDGRTLDDDEAEATLFTPVNIALASAAVLGLGGIAFFALRRKK